ncbi:MAG: FHA domain-containing protein [Steroidobacteraceae bacterium]
MDLGSLIAVELNDAGLRCARPGSGAAAMLEGDESPGFALLQEGRLLVGPQAVERHRVAPLHVQNRFWSMLGTEPLPWGTPGVTTAADLAHAQLSALLAPLVARGARELLLAVPPGYTREQLGLLVGIANECGVTTRGLVDLGVAACATVPPAPNMLHLDLQRHQAVATHVERARADGVLRRVRYELLPGVGLLALRQRMAEAIATAFVRETRFDPLHQSATEQQLHDSLPAWLERLAVQEETEAAIDFGGLTHRLVLQRAALAAAVDAFSGELLRLVQSARPAGVALHACITPRVASIPGLLERLATLRDCVTVMLAPGAAALGALQSAAHVVRAPDAISLVHRLPLQGSPQEPAAALADALAAVPVGAVPTHVLFRGQAWPLTAEALTLGWSVGSGPRGLALPAGIAGVSRAHCTLRLVDGQARVEDCSTYGTFVNDERVAGSVALRVGDVLRLGTPGVTLDLIRVLGSG